MGGIETTISNKIKVLSAQNRLDEKRIMVFGYNIYTEHINQCLNREGYELFGILDNDKAKQRNKICHVYIIDPEDIIWGTNDIVLIASKHKDSMMEQLRCLAKKVEIIILADIAGYIDKENRRIKFWLEENYKSEMEKLYCGLEIYSRLKEKGGLLIFPIPSLGDIFVGGLYLNEYEKRMKQDAKIVVSSKGAYKVAKLFEMRNVVIIEKEEMDELVKFVLFYRAEDDVVFTWIPALCEIAAYKNITFPKCWARYFFKLDNNYSLTFPSIWDKTLDDVKLEKNLVRGRTVIIAPYANSVRELPIQFWNLLVEKLLELKYCVLTNIAGDQKPIKGSTALEIPLNQIGNYLEFGGYFISIRSGLCDLSGRAKCKQIIVFRENKSNEISDIEYYDLHSESISENAIQYVYDDNDLFKNINMVLNFLINND